MLTAAHCTFDRYIASVMAPAALQVLVGEHDVMDSIPAARHQVSSIRNHERFSYSSLHFDISILTLAPAITLSSAAAPVCLPSFSQYPRYPDYTGQVATVTGWGETDSGSPSSTLREVTVTVEANDECSSAYDQIKE